MYKDYEGNQKKTMKVYVREEHEMKKRFVNQVFATTILLALLLAACGGPVATPSSTDETTKEAVTLDLWWLGTTDYDIATVNLLIDAYTKTNPHITVKANFISWDDFSNAMPSALSAGNPPSLAFGDPTAPNTPNFVKAGQLVDLTDLAAERGWEARLSPGVMDFYSPLYGDRTYAIPLFLAVRGFFYNKTIMGEIGGEIPQTVDEIEALFDKAKAAGYTPVLMGNADKYGSDVLWQNLLFQYLGATGKMEDFKSGTFLHKKGVPWGGEEMRQAMTRFLSWRDKGYINPDFASLILEDTHTMFAQGKAFGVVMGANEVARILEAEPDFEVGFFNFPPLKAGTPAYAISDPGAVLILPKDGKHRDEAIAFIDFLLTKEAGIIIANQGFVPAHRIDLADITVQDAYLKEVMAAATNQVPMGWLNYIAPFEFADRQGSELQKLLANEITLDAYLKLLQESYDFEVSQ
jgi:raffinose/stachyose/melibiose transport system substrate-binding protein